MNHSFLSFFSFAKNGSKNKGRRSFAALAVIALVLVLASCDLPQPSTSATPAQSPTQAQSSPIPTDEPAPTAALTTEPEPSETPDEGALSELIPTAKYLPRENIRVVMSRNLGDSSLSTITYVYARHDRIDDESYAVSQFDESQPIYYTDFYSDGDGLWSRFSDAQSQDISYIMPAYIEEDMGFISAGDEARVAEVGATFQHGDYTAHDCIIIATLSTAYSQDVYRVYQEGVGEIARYMLYDNDVIDMIFVVNTVEDISDEEAQAIVADSAF
ncbi:MAG: hypothetical protein ACOX8S_02900 [Christensenellales bacterium]